MVILIFPIFYVILVQKANYALCKQYRNRAKIQLHPSNACCWGQCLLRVPNVLDIEQSVVPPSPFLNRCHARPLSLAAIATESG